MSPRAVSVPRPSPGTAFDRPVTQHSSPAAAFGTAVKRAPEYLLLQRVKPGITSWGQVRYGYASNVDEMVERLRYDLLYLDNMSLTTDLKILVYTVIIIFQGRGK